MGRPQLAIILAGLAIGLSFLAGIGSAQAAHGGAVLYFTEPVGTGSNGAAHPLGHVTTLWHGTNNWALDFDEHLSDTDHGGYWGVFEAHHHVWASHPNYAAVVARGHTFYQVPGPSGCKELRTEFRNINTGKVEAEYVYYHIDNGRNIDWNVQGAADVFRLNDLFVGKTATGDSCRWDGTHIHETHRVRGEDHGHSHSFTLNTSYWCTGCHGAYNNISQWTRRVTW